MDEAKIRAWWSHRQGLDGRMTGQPAAAILEQTGWARSVGGAAPYLTLFSRGGIRREEADRAFANLQIHELPAARGCTYVVPAADYPLALLLSQNYSEVETKQARKLGMTDEEFHRLCQAVLKALEKGTLSPDELRDATGSASRSLGEEGKKKGLATTLPVAIGHLQSSGDIRRVPIDGRFDRQRYKYILWRPNPLANTKTELVEAYTELARRYFSWIGPASLDEFEWFSGLGVRAAKAAVAPLNLEPLAHDDTRLMLPGDRQRFESFQPPAEPQYVLTSSLDGIHLLRRDLRGLLTPDHRKLCVPVEKGHKEISTLTDLPSHAIFDRGSLIGLWAFDPEADAIAWMSFVPKHAALVKAVERTEDFIRADLGDARSFSLDSPASRAPRLEALRHATGHC